MCITIEIKCSTKEHNVFQESLFDEEDAYGGDYCTQSGQPNGKHGLGFHAKFVDSIYQ